LLINAAVSMLRRAPEGIPRYAPILASAVFSFFAVDGIAKPLK
jgi:hypothetical protein